MWTQTALSDLSAAHSCLTAIGEIAHDRLSGKEVSKTWKRLIEQARHEVATAQYTTARGTAGVEEYVPTGHILYLIVCAQQFFCGLVPFHGRLYGRGRRIMQALCRAEAAIQRAQRALSFL